MKKFRRIVCLLVALTMVFSVTTISADAASFTSKPKGVKAKCISGAAVRVSCKAKAGATGYNFYYNTRKGGQYTLGATSTSRSAVISGLTAGKKYYFKVQAYQGTDVITYSKMSKAAKCKTKLAKPKISVTDKCGCRVCFRLSCQDGTKGFLIYRSTKKKRGYKKIKTVNGGPTVEWNDTSVKASTTYYYKIKAYSGKYKTKYSSRVKVRTDARHEDGNSSSFNPYSSRGKTHMLIGGGDNKLTGHNILFLGSSITYGSATGGVSFADYIRVRNNANVKKLAVSGTTMANSSDKTSYVSRLKDEGPGCFYPDIFACQLSLNDSFVSRNIPVGTLPDIENTDLDELYEGAVSVGGAIGYITAYARENWPDCQVVFYTVRNNGYNTRYKEMRELLYKAQDKYGIKIIDMWSKSELTYLSGKNYCMYMADANHPKLAGYLYQWTPEFENKLIDWMPDRNTVTWKNGDTVLEKDRNVRDGQAPSYDGKEPVKAEDANNTYVFDYWEDGNGNRLTSQTIVVGDVIYTAVFKAIPKDNDQPENSGEGGGNGSEQNDPGQQSPGDGNGGSDEGSGNGSGGSDNDSDGGEQNTVPDITGMIQSLLRAA